MWAALATTMAGAFLVAGIPTIALLPRLITNSRPALPAALLLACQCNNALQRQFAHRTNESVISLRLDSVSDHVYSALMEAGP